MNINIYQLFYRKFALWKNLVKNLPRDIVWSGNFCSWTIGESHAARMCQRQDLNLGLLASSLTLSTVPG